MTTSLGIVLVNEASPTDDGDDAIMLLQNRLPSMPQMLEESTERTMDWIGSEAKARAGIDLSEAT